MPSEKPRTIYQPLHPSIRPRLDPEYVAYHDTILQYLPADDTRPWTPSFRTRTQSNITTTKAVPVGSVRDITIPNLSSDNDDDDASSPLQARIFTPDPNLSSPQPAQGWPLLLGGLGSENDLCALLCRTAGCVVVTVAYRLAPEHPYPAAVQDSLRALRWVGSEEASAELKSDRKRIAVGGTSAGGSLAAIVALQAASPSAAHPIHLTHQLLLLPVLDHTATPASPTWRQRPHAPWLTPARILWYRSLFFSTPPSQQSPQSQSQSDSQPPALLAAAQQSCREASPSLAPDEDLRRLPPTWVAVAGEDVLRGEAEVFADRLRGLGVPVRLRCYEGVGHSVLALCGILTKGQQLMRDAAEELRRAFHGEGSEGDK